MSGSPRRMPTRKQVTRGWVAIADADDVVGQPADREVLTEGARCQIIAAEVRPPVVEGLALVDHHGAILAAVTVEIALPVAIDVEPPHHDRTLHRSLVDPGADRLTVPVNVSGHSDVDRHQGSQRKLLWVAA
jgi:hypothetical protein